ncbi:tetratricopeptide repeat protein [Longirhabdus pacifica]|uniref:tetratricopeptide repeat protein n=1 Tax=Longirhabdus pacifica TaxID=2305227 RepID=UPI0010089B09|nr:tetratricopeptide repeat protein [Longirhabdus pacifica]
MKDLSTQLEQAVTLRKEGELSSSQSLLLSLVEAHPTDCMVHYQCAWTHDVMGLEKEAVPYYEKAIDLGLSGEDLRGALHGLGSTFRTLGEYEKAEQMLKKGMELFPEAKEFEAFYAMVLYNLGRYKEACQRLLNQLAETTCDEDIKLYKRAIMLYAEDLDRKW